MNKYVRKFNDMYNNLETQWESGEDDEQVLEMTLFLVDIIRSRSSFSIFGSFLSKSPKLIDEFGSEEGGSKRTKVFETSYNTSSDAHFRVDGMKWVNSSLKR